MKKVLLGVLFSVMVFASFGSLFARADVEVSVSLPVPIVFAAPPEMVVLPGTDIYVVPDVDADIYFYEGWWWRPWHGRWYRSHSYDSGWGYYQNVPAFFIDIPSGWRNDYREHRWHGQAWNYQRVPHQQVQANWSNWKKDKHWEKQNSRGVQGFNPGSHSRAVQPARMVHQPQAVQPNQRDHAVHGAKPVQNSQPARQVQTARKAQPARNTRPVQQAQPARNVQPAHEAQPVRNEQPAREAQPARNEQPAQREQPQSESGHAGEGDRNHGGR